MTSTQNRIIEILSGDHGDLRSNEFFLFKSSPLVITGILVFYYYLVKKWGPLLMQDRKPFELKTVMILYNMFQVFFNLALFLKVLDFSPNLSITCSDSKLWPASDAENAINTHFWFLMLKLFDLVETVFFVLRKKNKQISYLHVHHHIGMVTATWISGKYFPGGQGSFICVFNTIVHMIMYTYYLVACVSKASLWWKKYVTVLQVVQHYLIFATCITPCFNPYCSYPKGWLAFFNMNVILMIYLFTRFYINNYCRNKVKSS